MELEHKVKVVNEKNGIFGTECFIDGVKVDSVRSVDFSQTVGEFPRFTFETTGLPDIEMFGEVSFRFTPDTVQQAAVILQNEFRSNPESKNALVSSISSVLKKIPAEIGLYGVAELIANRIIGIESK